jgi:hypothetical protein
MEYDENLTIDASRLNFWGNPVDDKVYAGVGQPNYGFGESGQDFYPVYDLAVLAQNRDLMKADKMDEITKSPWTGDMADRYAEWHSNMQAGGQQRTAAQTSADHQAIEILNVHGEVFGRKERTFAGRNLAQTVNVPNLVLDVDTLAKMNNLERIPELGVPKPKQISYTRAHYEADKFAMIVETSEEDQLKNLHNPHQDAITVAGTKVESRGSWDTINELQTNLTTLAGTDWEAFEAGADRSTNNPQIDIGKVTLNTDGTGVGGKMNRIGFHQFTLARWRGNSYNRGLIDPTKTNYEPGSEALGGGMDGIGAVKDQMIDQGLGLAVSTEQEPTCFYLQGPQRVASEHNQITGSDVWGIFDFHLAVIINSLTGRALTGLTTPLAW